MIRRIICNRWAMEHPKHPDRGEYEGLDVYVDGPEGPGGRPLRHVQVSVSPSGRSARVWVDGREVKEADHG